MAVIFIFGGCNGAGKTTVALPVTRDLLGTSEFLNADLIAAKIAPEQPNQASYAASKILLAQLKERIAQNLSFSLESTLSSVTLAPILQDCKYKGYTINLIYLWLGSPELAYERVQRRTQLGGHYVPKKILFRRYYRSIFNLHRLYIPLVDNLWVYDNSGKIPILVSRRKNGNAIEIYQPGIWAKIQSCCPARVG
jgi:predicted ABC-type ATPase